MGLRKIIGNTLIVIGCIILFSFAIYCQFNMYDVNNFEKFIFVVISMILLLIGAKIHGDEVREIEEEEDGLC